MAPRGSPPRTTALTHVCQECGAAAPLDALARDLVCTFCGAPQRLDPGLEEALLRYAARVGELSQGVRRELDEANRLRSYRDVGGPIQPPPEPGDQAFWCPNCGAKNELSVGQALSNCGHCEGPMLPDLPAMARGTSNALRRHADAQRRRISEERRTTLWRQTHSYMSSGCNLFLPLLALACAGSLLFLILLTLMDGQSPGMAGPVLLAGTLLFGGLSVPILWRRNRCRGLSEDQLAVLVRAAGGGRITRFSQLRSYLDSRWPSYYHPFFLSKSAYTDYAELVWRGVPVLLNLHPRARDILDTARVHLLLARPISGVLDHDPVGFRWMMEVGEELRQDLANLGYSVQVCASGLLVAGDLRVIQGLDSDPARVADLEAVLELAARLAEAMAVAGEKGVEPCPGPSKQIT